MASMRATTWRPQGGARAEARGITGNVQGGRSARIARRFDDGGARRGSLRPLKCPRHPKRAHVVYRRSRAGARLATSPAPLAHADTPSGRRSFEKTRIDEVVHALQRRSRGGRCASEPRWMSWARRSPPRSDCSAGAAGALRCMAATAGLRATRAVRMRTRCRGLRSAPRPRVPHPARRQPVQLLRARRARRTRA